MSERDRPAAGRAPSSPGAGIGTESTRSWASLNMSVRKGLRSSTGTEENSIGDKDFSASWRAAIASFEVAGQALRDLRQ